MSKKNNRSVFVGETEYFIDKRGIGRKRVGNEIDREFADPITAYLKEHDLSVSNILAVTFNEELAVVFYEWQAVKFAYYLVEKRWSAPIEKSSRRKYL